MAEELKQLIQEATSGLREDMRGVGVNVEAVQSDVKQVLEVVDTHTEQLKRLEGVPGKLDRIDARLDVIETTLESVNLPMFKQKFIALEKRVAQLEAKER